MARMRLSDKLDELRTVLEAGQLSDSEQRFIEDAIQAHDDGETFSDYERQKINDLWEHKCG